MLIDVNNETQFDIDELALSEQATFMLHRLYINSAAELSIVLVDEPTIERLHVEWMDLPGPTDVMSFPMDELRAGTPEKDSGEGILGDIVLCPEFARKQAITAGHSLEVEMRLLLTHGILHLLGHDHAEPEEHKVMFALQAQLLAEWEAQRNERGIG